jgi:hypothetical protein
VRKKFPDGDAGTPGIFRPQGGHLNRGVMLIVARPDWRPRKTGGFPRRTSDGFATISMAGGLSLSCLILDCAKRHGRKTSTGDVLPGMELCDLAARSASGLRR